jgi:hypothetical protein
VEKVDVNLKKARGFLTLKADARLEPEQMRLAVVKAGFTPRDVTFTAVGHLVQQEGKALFKVQGSGQLIPLEANAQLTALQQAVGSGDKLVSVTARIPADQEVAQIEQFTVP